MSKLVLSVSQLNTYVKSILEGDENLTYVFITGEISNFSNHYRSGHLYFSLKDSGASIQSVMFKSAASRLKFLPQNGMRVVVRGRVSLYERDGSYQLYVDDLQPDGMGALHLAYEQLKEKLAKEGLFDEERKRLLPKFPQTIGVVTSPTGAAVQDIFSILRRRYPMADIIQAAVSVQGSAAPGEIVAAIELLNQKGNCDVIILGRGGGSIEELWCFNEEKVARAVAASIIPVISAVGHETDFTICDFAADCRAPTPSAAAEIAVPDRLELQASVEMSLSRMTQMMNAQIMQYREKLLFVTSKRCFASPAGFIDTCRIRLDFANTSLQKAFTHECAKTRERFTIKISKLDALSPLKVLSRGYAICYQDQKCIKQITDIDTGEKMNVQLSDGFLECTVNARNKAI